MDEPAWTRSGPGAWPRTGWGHSAAGPPPSAAPSEGAAPRGGGGSGQRRSGQTPGPTQVQPGQSAGRGSGGDRTVKRPRVPAGSRTAPHPGGPGHAHALHQPSFLSLTPEPVACALENTEPSGSSFQRAVPGAHPSRGGEAEGSPFSESSPGLALVARFLHCEET